MGAVNAAPQPLAMPGDPDWATTEACSLDTQFVEVKDLVPMNATLRSRHVMCTRGDTAEQTIRMNMMKSVDGKTWEVYKAPATGRTVATCVVGWASFRTFFQIFGPAASNQMSLSLKMRVNTFVRNTGKAGEPGSRGDTVCPGTDFKIAVVPSLPISPAMGTSKGIPYNLQISANPPEFEAPMYVGGTTGPYQNKKFQATINWSAQDSASHLRFQYFPSGYSYRVNGSDVFNGVVYTIASGISAVPELRCDKGMATTTSTGCVFPEAAPVFVLDSSKYPEVADHIREAMAGASVGMTAPAAGGFKLAPGTKAVGLNTQGSVPMRRVKDNALQKASRDAACGDSAASLINARQPRNASPSCPAGAAGCSCDEYPFAASDAGASWNAGATSAKFINAQQNSASGNELLSKLFTPQRVLDLNDDDDYFWVFVK